jgi:hypothetical protein
MQTDELLAYRSIFRGLKWTRDLDVLPKLGASAWPINRIRIPECFFHAPLADAAPRADEVRVNGNSVHNAVLWLCFLF